MTVTYVEYEYGYNSVPVWIHQYPRRLRRRGLFEERGLSVNLIARAQASEAFGGDAGSMTRGASVSLDTVLYCIDRRLAGSHRKKRE